MVITVYLLCKFIDIPGGHSSFNYVQNKHNIDARPLTTNHVYCLYNVK